VVGAGALAARVMFGAVWKWVGAGAAFGLGAGLALIAVVLLFLAVPSGPMEDAVRGAQPKP
jgi:hypothetical protein